MNKYSIYVGGTYDEKKHAMSGGRLDSVHDTERDAFRREKELQWEFLKGVYMVCEGDERFKIVPCSGLGCNYAIVDKRTGTNLYGACPTMDGAIEAKKDIEKYHYEGGKWMDEYYEQFKTA